MGHLPKDVRYCSFYLYEIVTIIKVANGRELVLLGHGNTHQYDTMLQKLIAKCESFTAPLSRMKL